MDYYLVAFLAFISYALYKCYIHPFYLSPLRKIPGPPLDNLILGHYATFLNKEIGEALFYLAKQYGGIVRSHGLFNKPYLLISDPKIVQQVLVNRPYDHPKYFTNREMVKEFFGKGICLLKQMVPTFVQAGHKLKDLWMKQIGDQKEERITITAIISKITLDIIGLVGFNYKFNSTTSDSELAQAYKTLFYRNPSPLYTALEENLSFIKKLPITYYKQHYASLKTIRNISEKLIAEQKNAIVRGKDLLSLLVKANEQSPVDEQLTHEELISQVMTILIAGHETTSTLLSWTLYFLAKNPDIQDRLRKEIFEVFTDRNHFPTFDEIEQLKYLECVFKETLRIIPPDFNPSRWLDPEIKSKVTNNNFIPFGAGPASCLGLKMTHLELKSILAVIIRNLEFRLVEGYTFKKKFFGLSKPIPGIDLWVSKVDS
ncbi:37257_t:CDS:2 [Gigaspora margarita]|uniref:37257_t:CDS:1 n=1 Tax=Gigaspora margarita TaxID=4874 RepID=A0ABN7W7U6_GIGMA|nr:37257_t:CDS:2 [Gigaspora margarita]